MKLYILLLVSFLNLAFQEAIHASFHVCDAPDTEFINLGKQFPSVGYFSSSSELCLGSGTLVDVGIPELSNRVVITCAHMFDKVDSNEIIFTCGDEVPVKGKVFIQPQYTEGYKQHGWAPAINDIAVFVLERPLLSIPSVQADDSPYQDLINKDVIQVGYRLTGYLWGKYFIKDLEKRASYSYVPSHRNYLEDVEEIIDFTEDLKEPYRATFMVPVGSQLTVTPWEAIETKDNEPVMKFSRRPSGLACNGDSGGGCFNEEKLFLGVISGGNIGKFARELILEQKFFEKYKTIHAGVSAELEKLNEMLQENERVKRPLIVSDINPYFSPYYETQSAEPDEYSHSKGKVALFGYHKKWILETLQAHLATMG